MAKWYHKLTPEYEALLEETYAKTRPWPNRHRAYKLALMAMEPICFWCDRTVKDYGHPIKGVLFPDDEATVDHIVSRFFRKKGDVVKKVLSCRRCNLRRGKADERLVQNTKKS